MAKQKPPVATADQFEGLTLMRMRVENVKRVRLVDATLRDTLTVIGGDNAQGKTSFINSYAWCLGGKAEIEMQPIHEGKQEGSILCDFGDGKRVKLTVERTLQRVGNDGWTSDIDITIPDGVAPTQVETFLKALAGSMSFDPMAFDEMEEAEQFEALRKFVPDFDFNGNAAEHDKLFKQRTDIKRDQKRAQSAAESITVDGEPPCEHVDEELLVARLNQASHQNAAIERDKANRANAVAEIARLNAAADAGIASIEGEAKKLQDAHAAAVEELEAQITRLRARITAADTQLVEALKELNERRRREAEEQRKRAADLQHELDSAEPLAKPVNADEITARLTAAREGNRRLAEWANQAERRDAHQAEADKLAVESDELTAKLTELEQARQDAIAKAHLPVSGIGFADGYITLNGQPWQQASTAERVDASTAIAMALNPKLKVILIHNGSNLGSAMKQRIVERASAQGYRVLMEIVDETGANSHVFIEDGVVGVVKQPPERTGAAA